MGSVKGLNIAIFAFFGLTSILFSIAHFGTEDPVRGTAYAAFTVVSILLTVREIKLWKKERNSRRF